MDKNSKKLLATVRRTRKFPANTCGASRHVQMIAESLIREKPYPMLQEEAEHCGADMLATVASLYAARTKIAEMEATIRRLTTADAGRFAKLGPDPRAVMPEGYTAPLDTTPTRVQIAQRLTGAE